MKVIDYVLFLCVIYGTLFGSRWNNKIDITWCFKTLNQLRYEIDKFIDKEIVSGVTEEMEATKKDYAERLKPIFEKHEPGKEQMLDTILEQQIDKGRPLHEYYEDVCEKYKILEMKQKREHRRLYPI